MQGLPKSTRNESLPLDISNAMRHDSIKEKKTGVKSVKAQKWQTTECLSEMDENGVTLMSPSSPRFPELAR